MWLLPLLTFLQWKKPYPKLFSGMKFLFVNLFSKLLWHVLRHMECKMVASYWHGHLFLEVFQKSEILKNAVSGRWCS